MGGGGEVTTGLSMMMIMKVSIKTQQRNNTHVAAVAVPADDDKFPLLIAREKVQKAHTMSPMSVFPMDTSLYRGDLTLSVRLCLFENNT